MTAATSPIIDVFCLSFTIRHIFNTCPINSQLSICHQHFKLPLVFPSFLSKGKNRFFFVRLSSSANSVSIGRSYVLKSKRRGLHTSGEWWRVADPVKIYLETTSSFLLMCRRHWRLLLLDAFYHSIGSNILDVHVLLWSWTSRHKSVPSTLENCHTYIHMLSKIIVVKRGKIGVDWKIWLKFLPLQNTIQKKATMPELLYSIGFQRRENTVSNREKVCKAWVVPCRQALLCMMDVRIKNRRDFFLYPSSIRGVIISKLPFDIWPRRRWIFRLGSSASSGINYSADLDV